MADIIDLIKTGDCAKRVDIVIVAEGYTAAERSKFIADAQKFLENFLGQENAKLNAPFSNYQGFFNAKGLFFASAQSGMDQPNNGIVADTYFNASQYLTDGRLLYGDENKVQFEVSKALASNAHELTIVLVNTSIYGGAGGYVAWASAGNSAASELALHEIGHSYAGLQDEYVDKNIVDSFSLNSPSFLKSPHVTDSLNRIPWKEWLGFDDGDLGVVGAYEGGYYRSSGVWRATVNSKMLYLGQSFSAPQKEAFALQFYADIGDYLSVTNSIPGIYQAVTPNANVLSFTWAVNGKALEVNKGNIFDVYASGGYAVGKQLSLTTIDSTGLIRKNLSSTQQVETMNMIDPVIKITDVNYHFSTADNGKIYQFNDVDNVLKIDDMSTTMRLYIDGGAGNDKLQFNSNLSAGANMQIQQVSDGTFLISSQGTTKWATHQVESLIFKDYTVNLNIASNAAGISQKDLDNLSELYVAYFNRIPEADGLDYWITQFKNGMTLTQIGDAFFIAAQDYPSLTGYSASMTDVEFINVIYKNSLGRVGGADEGGLNYWLQEFVNGTMTKGSMVHAVLVGAHERKSGADPALVLEANLLDNKIAVANKFAVEWGLNYLTPEQSIINGIKIAALVTPTDYQLAINLIGIADGQIVFLQ